MEDISFFTICGNKVHAISIPDILQQIQIWIDHNNEGRFIVVANTHVMMESREDVGLKAALEKADLVAPDGMPLVVVGRLRGLPLSERADGPGLMSAALETGQGLGWRHFFYGSTPEVLEGMQSQVSQRWPQAKIAGCIAPPFRSMSEEEEKSVIEKINNSEADILWVGLGCPKQEKWMADHCVSLNVPVSLGVGQAFDLLAGLKKRAPLWMQRFGLEWLFRLIQEPKRLWRRYLLYNSQFIYLVIREQIQYWREK